MKRDIKNIHCFSFPYEMPNLVRMNEKNIISQKLIVMRKKSVSRDKERPPEKGIPIL